MVKILGLKKGVPEFDKSTEKEEEKDGTRFKMKLNSFSVTYQAFGDGRITFLALLFCQEKKNSLHLAQCKESYNAKLWMSFMPPAELANKYSAHLVNCRVNAF
jgi:hypothetical protein